MSQYIQGIVDYVPQIQPFKPNLNFFQQVLQTKEAQYKAGYDKISNLYGTLLESPMLRQDNIELRNTFFNDISKEITKISGLDLSLPQNIDAAQQVFQPLVDNDYILKDMAFTKQLYSEFKRADNFRNCTDEKACGGKYWEGGVRYLEYKARDFINASPDDSLKMSAPKYTPFVNVSKEAMAFAKASGFDMKTVSWSPDGRYQITTKNGIQMVPSLTNAFLAAFGNDQRAIDYYGVKSYLSRKDFAVQNAAQYGSEAAAENYYLDQMAAALFDTANTFEKGAQRDLDLIRNNKSAADAIISSAGVDPSDPDDQRLVMSRNQAMVEEMIARAAEEKYKLTKDAVEPTIINTLALDAKRSRVDAAVAQGLLISDLSSTAAAYAELTMEQDIKADPYGVASYEHALALDKMAKQFGYDVELENLKTANEILKKTYEDGTPLGQSTNSESNTYVPDVPGGGSSAVVDLAAEDAQVFTSVNDAMSSDLNNYMYTVNDKLNEIINTPVNAFYGNVRVTPEIQSWARNKQKELFGQADSNIYRPQAEEKEEKGGFWSELGTAIIGAAGIAATGGVDYTAGIDSYKSPSPKASGSTGYLNPDGTLIKDPMLDPGFHDKNSKNHWHTMVKRLDSFVDADPIATKLFANDASVRQAKGKNADAQQLYFAHYNATKNNHTVVNNALLSHGLTKELIAETDRPSYALSQLKNIEKDGRLKTKEEFVNDYVKNAPTVKPYVGVEPSMIPGGMRPTFGTLFPSSAKNEAEELYDDYTKQFRKIYNRESDAPITEIKGYKPLFAGYTVGQGGAGLQRNPVTIRNIDVAFPGDVGAKDFSNLYSNVLSAMRQDPNSVKIVAGSGQSLNSEVWEDAESFDKGLDILGYIQGQMAAGVKKTQTKRAIFDMTVHPVIANDPNKVGFTIKLSDVFINENKGSKNKAGITEGAEKEFTIVMDKSKVEADAYTRLNRGSYGTLMSLDNQINLNQFSKYGGTLNIRPNGRGGYTTSGSLKFFDPETQTFGDVAYNEDSNPGDSPDNIAHRLNNLLYDLYEQNYQVDQALRQLKPNLIKDPSQFD